MHAWIKGAWPIAVFFLGQASTYFTSFINEKRQIARDSKARQAERAKAVIDRRETFELDHLVRLNEALQDFARCAMKVHLADLNSSEHTGHYAGTLLPDGLSEEFMQLGRTVRMLGNLVLDDDLRAQVDEARTALHRPSMMHRGEASEARRALNQATDLLTAAQEAVARRIREIYANAEA
ncbi:hypothetical protein [Streptomyces sp. NPDC047024]|uniref:hypothetical protein n=1 Tax=Streptomyces sp. NPDC047024 TaxID=3155476 RepID=UPI0033CDB094